MVMMMMMMMYPGQRSSGRSRLRSPEGVNCVPVSKTSSPFLGPTKPKFLIWDCGGWMALGCESVDCEGMGCQVMGVWLCRAVGLLPLRCCHIHAIYVAAVDILTQVASGVQEAERTSLSTVFMAWQRSSRLMTPDDSSVLQLRWPRNADLSDRTLRH